MGEGYRGRATVITETSWKLRFGEGQVWAGGMRSPDHTTAAPGLGWGTGHPRGPRGGTSVQYADQKGAVGSLGLDGQEQLGTGQVNVGGVARKGREKVKHEKGQDFQLHIPRRKRGTPGQQTILPGPSGSSQRWSLVRSPSATSEA